MEKEIIKSKYAGNLEPSFMKNEYVDNIYSIIDFSNETISACGNTNNCKQQYFNEFNKKKFNSNEYQATVV